jgi:hypothetical protein
MIALGVSAAPFSQMRDANQSAGIEIGTAIALTHRRLGDRHVHFTKSANRFTISAKPIRRNGETVSQKLRNIVVPEILSRRGDPPRDEFF